MSQSAIDSPSSQIDDGSVLSTVALNASNGVAWADHCVQHTCVVPGAFYVDAAAKAIENGERQVAAFKDVRFEQVYVLVDSNDADAQFKLAASEDGVKLEFLSPGLGSDRTRHASMHVELRDKLTAGASLPMIRVPDVSGWAQLSGDSIYRQLDRNGNQYGPSFRGIKKAAVGDGECLADIFFPKLDEQSLKGPGVPTVLLDVCAHVLATIGIDNEKTFVLEGIDELRIDRPLSKRFRVWARLDKSDSDSRLGDVDVFDDSGATLFRLKGVRFGNLENATSSDGMRGDLKDTARETMAVSATFTSEPLEGTLAFWAKQFGRNLAAKFAPFNQTFQELLDPQSLLATNESGFNVTALRLEDWTHSVSGKGNANPSGNGTSAAIGSASYRLPNNLVVSHVNDYETEYLFKEIFTDRCYVRHGINLDDAKCVIDIGANIGMFTMFIQQQCPDAKVFSFEPGPRVFESLNSNCGLINGNAKAFNCGVADKTGEATFTYYEKSTVFSTFSANEADDKAAIRAVIENRVQDGGDAGEADETASVEEVDQIVDELLGGRLEAKTMTCPLVTISDVIRENGIERIDLLKVDAEKSELPILQGIDEEDWPKIQQIVIEVHDKVGDLIETVVKLLKSKGFVFEMTEEELLRNSGLYNIYATRNDKTAASNESTENMRLSARDRQLIEQAADDFVAAAQSFSQRSHLPHVIAIGAPSPRLAESKPDAQYLAGVEDDLLERLSVLNEVTVLPSQTVTRWYPVDDYFDSVSDQAGKIPYTSAYYSGLATSIFRKYYAANRQQHKVIVLDCDNTIWKGVCGERGADGIELDKPRLALQAFVKQKIQEGMVVCLCSKNVEDDVFAVFDSRNDMILKREDLVGKRINWEPKSANLVSLAEELNLGLDSFIMIDDSPVECAEIRANCPEVLTLQLPVDDAESIPRFLDHVWAFDQVAASEEARNRTKLYQDNAKREDLRSSAISLSEFISSLNLDIRIAWVDEGDVQRVSELTQRTNQFNVSTKRRSTSELRSLIDQGYECAVVHVSDRFGDYGLVGALILQSGEHALVVDTMLLSCRVLGRGVEHEMLAWTGRKAQERGLNDVEIPYHQTEKNVPASQFLESIDAGQKKVISDKNTLFKFSSTELTHLQFRAEDAAQPTTKATRKTKSNNSTESTSDRLFDLDYKIATEMYAAERIHELSQETVRVHQRPEVNTIYLAPKSETEQRIADTFAHVLSLDKVGVRDNFFDLGGTSLRAVQLIAELQRKHSFQIPVVSLFAEPTVEALVRLVDGDADSGEKAQEGKQRGEARRQARSRRRKSR